jgi:hypothetical protein
VPRFGADSEAVEPFPGRYADGSVIPGHKEICPPKDEPVGRSRRPPLLDVGRGEAFKGERDHNGKVAARRYFDKCIKQAHNGSINQAMDQNDP